MSETEPIDLFGPGSSRSAARGKRSQSNAQEPDRIADFRPPSQTVFNRRELNEILKVYGRKVADGEWRDYAIDMGRDRAVFSIFRRSSEMPLYRIEKLPKLARRQGMYSVVAATGLILKRGQDLAQVLRVIDRKPKLVAMLD